jgi:hypothetical protein
LRASTALAGLFAGGVALGAAATVLATHDTREPVGAVEIAMARVRSVAPLSRLEAIKRAGRLAAKPAIEVVLQVAPAEGGDSVLAKDVIDVGSVDGLTAGGTEQVFYPENRPAAARMIRGSRADPVDGWALAGNAVAASVLLLIACRYWLARREAIGPDRR